MKNDKMKNQYRVNEQIRVREVRVVSEDGSQVLPTRQALDMARQMEVDLGDISKCTTTCLSSYRLFQVPLPAEETSERDEAEAGEGGSEGNTLRTSDR